MNDTEGPRHGRQRGETTRLRKHGSGAGDLPREKLNDNKTELSKHATRMKKLLVLITAFAAFGVVSASAADAKEAYDKSCAKCHGPDGKGQTKMGQKLGIKDYTDAKVQAGFTDEEAFKSLKEGMKDKDDKTLMKPVENLSDDEIKGLVKYVRAFKQ
jgi:cytochrome c553